MMDYLLRLQDTFSKIYKYIYLSSFSIENNLHVFEKMTLFAFPVSNCRNT